MKSGLIYLISLYQYFFSPDNGVLKGLYPFRGACVMYPTCSTYMIQVIEKYGALKGFFIGLRRIGRCHPFQKKLIDIP